ncbi:hypothetical protein P8452_67379 [Trifolium repens]|nr:hypothetical protein P8452_67379 [Trifolium repens]
MNLEDDAFKSKKADDFDSGDDGKCKGGSKIQVAISFSIHRSSSSSISISITDQSVRVLQSQLSYSAISTFNSRNRSSIMRVSLLNSIATKLNFNSWIHIHNHNSTITIAVDGGKEPRTTFVIGGHQLEDNILEFDLVSSKLGFSSSLLLHNELFSWLFAKNEMRILMVGLDAAGFNVETVDNDRDRVVEARDELHRMLNETIKESFGGFGLKKNGKK